MFVGLVAAAMKKRTPDEKLPDPIAAATKVCTQGK
jgi:hypothetical protein